MIEKRWFIPIRSNKKPVENSGSNTQEFSGRERQHARNVSYHKKAVISKYASDKRADVFSYF
jgi:hypothetical protein